MNNETIYRDKLKEVVYKKISEEITNDTFITIIKEHIKPNIESNQDFFTYYFTILKNEAYFLTKGRFFHEFKRRYSLQGIDNNFLNGLELKKQEIFNLISSNDLATLYFENFRNAEIQHGINTRKKDLGSFYAKLIHTFLPEQYCALDNPVKDYFGLKKESFFISQLAISEA